MGEAKNIIVKPISSADARRIIKHLHYSGKTVNNSVLHLGVFINGRCEGAMQFGSPLDKRKILPIVRDTAWTGMLELNRMAFSDRLPRNSESRAIGIAMRMIKKSYPHIEWIISFADGTQCGDGAIYRAGGFCLVGIKKSTNLIKLPDGTVIHKMTLESNPTAPRMELGGKSYYDITGGRYDFNLYRETVAGETTSGFQIKYIYFINKAAKDRLSVPVLPFAVIDEVGAGMYKGIKRAKQAMAGTTGTATGQNRSARSI